MVSEELRKIIDCGNCSERSCDGMSCLTGLVQSLRDKRDQLEKAIVDALDSHWGGGMEYEDEEIAVRRKLCAVLSFQRGWRQDAPKTDTECSDE